jgi:putative ATPase
VADLFDQHAAQDADDRQRPLADRLRPTRLGDVIGQEKLLGPDGPLGAMLAGGSLSSLILWGPPGVGKTTIARLLAAETDLRFVQISAIFTGVADLKKVFEEARLRRRTGRGRSFSSTRSTASTRRSRTDSCRTWRTARSSSSAPRPRTRRSN